MTRGIEAAPAALPHTHALMAMQRALPRWSVTDLARAVRSPALGRLTRHAGAPGPRALNAEDDLASSAAIVQAGGCSLILNPSTPSA